MNEYNFDGGVKSKRNSALEKINDESAKVKERINLNSDSKILILELETESHEKRDKITITPDGLLGSMRKKKDKYDNNVYFGYKEGNDIVIIFIYIIIYLI